MVTVSIAVAVATAAAQFALAHVKDKSRQAELRAVYSHAAESVIASFESDGYSAGTPIWKAIVNIVRDPNFSGALAFKGDLVTLDLRGLQSQYGQDAPSFEDILTRMVDRINSLSLEMVPTKARTLGRVIASLELVKRVRDKQLFIELAENTDLTRQTKENTEKILANLEGRYDVRDGAIESQAQPLPSDEDYRVERPEMAELTDRLASDDVVGIAGESGVGKSLLAIHYARVTFPASTIYVSLDSGDVRSSMNAIARGLGIGIAPEFSDDEASRHLRHFLAQHHGLLLLDNAESAADTRMMIPSVGGDCKTIITSRDQSLIKSLIDADPMVMEQFTEDQAKECFRRRLGRERCEEETDDVDKLCDLLGYLPLAVDVAAAIIHAEELPVTKWLELFPTEMAQLDALNPEDIDVADLSASQARNYKVVWAVLRLGLRNLGEIPGRLIFATSCFDPGSGALGQLLIPVAGLSESHQPTALRELNRLCQRSILRVTHDSIGGDRYTMHRLMRVVAQKESGELIEEFEERWLSSMASLASQLNSWISDDKSNLANRVFNQESPNIQIAAAKLMEGIRESSSTKAENGKSLTEFVVNIAQFTRTTWPFEVQRQLLEAAFQHADAVDASDLIAQTSLALGNLDQLENKLANARSKYTTALRYFAIINDANGEANSLRSLGDLNLREERLSEARINYMQALPIYRKLKIRIGEANTLTSLGDLEFREDNLPKARANYSLALPICEEIQDSVVMANTLRSLGNLDLREDNLADARTNFDLALPIFREVQERLGEANTLRALGNLDYWENRLTDARSNLELALTIFGEIQERLGEANALRSLGDLDFDEHDSTDARLKYNLALNIFRDIEEALGESNTLQSFAKMDSAEGASAKAEQGFLAASQILNRINYPLGMRSNWGYLGQHYARNDQPVLAIKAYQESLAAMPKESDPSGYLTSLRGQAVAFQKIKNGTGFVACLKLLSDLDDGVKKQYEETMDLLKENSLPGQFDELQQAIEEDPDGLRLASIEQLVERVSAATESQTPDMDAKGPE